MEGVITHDPLDVIEETIQLNNETNKGQSSYLYRAKVTPIYSHPGEIAAQLFLILFGIIGNSMNQVVLKGFKNSSVFYYIRILALLDLVYCLSLLIYQVYKAMGFVTSSLTFIQFFVYFDFPLTLSLPTLSSFVTVVICITRFILVQCPIKGRFCTGTNPAKIILALTLTLVLTFVLPLIYKGLTYMEEEVQPGHFVYQYRWAPWFFTDPAQNYLLAAAVLTEYLVTLILILFGTLLLVTLKMQNIKRAKMTSKSDDTKDSERQIVVLVISVVILHAFCETPRTLVRSDFINIPRKLRTNLILVANLLRTFNHSINFWMYLVNHKWFRAETMKKLRRLGKARDVHMEASTSERGQIGSTVHPTKSTAATRATKHNAVSSTI